MTSALVPYAGNSRDRPFSVTLRKPFGVGFHVDPHQDGVPVVVDVKGERARTLGVKKGLKLVELNGRNVRYLPIDQLRSALGQIPTGVDATLTFEPASPEKEETLCLPAPPRGDLRQDLNSGYFGSFNSLISGISDLDNEPDPDHPNFAERGEWPEQLSKPLGIAFIEEAPIKTPPVGCVAVDRKLPTCAARVKPGDRLVELNGQSLVDKPYKEVLRILRKLPVGVVCTFVFARPAVASPLMLAGIEDAERWSAERWSGLVRERKATWLSEDGLPGGDSFDGQPSPFTPVGMAGSPSMRYSGGIRAGSLRSNGSLRNGRGTSDSHDRSTSESSLRSLSMTNVNAQTIGDGTQASRTPDKYAQRAQQLERERVRILEGSGTPSQEETPQEGAWSLGSYIQARLKKPFGIRFYKDHGRSLMVDDVKGEAAQASGLQKGDILECVNGANITAQHPSTSLKMLKELPNDALVAMVFRRPGMGATGATGATGGKGAGPPNGAPSTVSTPHRGAIQEEMRGHGMASAQAQMANATVEGSMADIEGSMAGPVGGPVGAPPGVVFEGSTLHEPSNGPAQGAKAACATYPGLVGWMEKKGNVFWNMRYFSLKEHVLTYYDDEACSIARAIVPLEGAYVSITNNILKIDITNQRLGMGIFDRARFGNCLRIWHRESQQVQLWFDVITESIKVHEARRS